MKLISQLLPRSQHLQLQHCEFDRAQKHLKIAVRSTQPSSDCPLCSQVAQRRHSQYHRTLTDLAWAQYHVTIQLQVRKFFCDNAACRRRIFTERLPHIVAPWARRTERLDKQLEAVALALGGAAGARLCRQLGCEVSRTTLLRLVLRLPLPPIGTPKTVGVDDFSFRRRQTYGTLLVDLDQHRPIAILPGRKAETLATWLEQHPGIKTLSRDRSKIYKRGMNEGAPSAIQVADRFHLIQNLAATLEQALSSHSKDLKAAEVAYRMAQAQGESPNCCAIPLDNPSPNGLLQPSAHRQQRAAIHQQVWELYNQGWSSAAIAHQVGMSLRTVQRDLRKPNYAPVYRRGNYGKRDIDPYRDYLQQRCQSGQRPKGLMQELRNLGYRGSERSLQRALQQLRQTQAIAPKRLSLQTVFPKVVKPLLASLTPSRLTWMVLRTSRPRTEEEEQLLHTLMTQPSAATAAIELAEQFATLVRQRQIQALEPWLEQAQASEFIPFQRFAQSLREDQQAVQAALTSAVSNGQVEGQVNRLKMLKRQMYGRAGTELLSRRLLLAS